MAKPPTKKTFEQLRKSSELPGKTASRIQTMQSYRHNPLAPSDRIAGYLRDIEDKVPAFPNEPEIDTGYDYEPRTPETLPAIINKAVVRSGHHFDVKWHMVKHLPGYFQSAIRTLGRHVFATFTDTPIEKIQVLSTFTNSETELKQMGTWIMRNGHKDDHMTMSFQRIFENYDAEVAVWNVEGYSFAVVKDFAGKYIYGWPGGRGTKIPSTPPKRLK